MTHLGLGTYRCPDVPAAAAMAAAGGAPLIDTAPNYQGGLAQRNLAGVLADRPGIRVSSKVGYLTREQGRAACAAGVLPGEDARHGHSLDARYIAYQVGASIKELGRPVDLMYVHNPESTSRPHQLEGDLLRAFAVLEEAAVDGTIGGYGIATWRAFTDGLVSMPTLLAAARDVGGDGHHLRAIQLPVNLVHLTVTAQALHGTGPIAEATAAGLEVWTSAPLNGSDLLGMVGEELAAAIRPGLTPAQAALLVVASTPGITGMLLSTGNPDHWQEAQAAVQMGSLTASELGAVCEMLQVEAH
ncbi:aldo/keto reductase [Actinocorallia longicatena]|uniref:Aldo/keto reductase n=1 Tax=Actinocorallia longicatena TaxID=111803 RepID=A0ABP6Q5M2_9ACTN